MGARGASPCLDGVVSLDEWVERAGPGPSAIDPGTIQAYLETDYRVLDPAPCVLRVGVRSEALDAVHRAHGASGSALLTAFNPFGARVTDAENEAAQGALRAGLTRRGLGVLDAVGVHPSNGWPPEPSFLVLGLTRDEAEALGRALSQDAILWSGPKAVPALVLLR
jgi:hypothetical protein